MSLHICIGCFKEISSDCEECPHCKIKYPFERGRYDCLECKETFIHPLKKEACNKCGSKRYTFVPLIDSRLWNKYITKKDIDDAVWNDSIYEDIRLASKNKYKKYRIIAYPLIFIPIFILFWMGRNDTGDYSIIIMVAGIAILAFLPVVMFIEGGALEWILYKLFIYKEALHEQTEPIREIDIPIEIGVYSKYLIRGHIFNRLKEMLTTFSKHDRIRKNIIHYRYLKDSTDGKILDIQKESKFYPPPQVKG